MGLTLVYLGLIPLSEKYKKLGPHRDKLMHLIMANGTIRLFMEGYLELCLFSMLNIKEMRWDLPFPVIEASNMLAIMVLMAVLIVPLILFGYYHKHLGLWDNEDF